ncbi:MAG: 5-formyltetrahydrofolate cyclo-ligase, partial [Epsilonproteobacteria bacterium]|nr:5-formyltetrahydrofolate cyclo-ligase [Campylobacterota bacterium]
MDKKSRFRKEALELLRDYNLPFRLKKELNYYLYKYIKQKGYKKVMLYIPLKSEVDINWLIKRLRMEKVEIFVPFMEGESFKLVKYKLP